MLSKSKARYSAFLADRSVPATLSSSFLGRLPDSMVATAMLFWLARSGGFGMAGIVSGAYSVGYAVTSPLRGNIVDRLGARKSLVFLGGAQSLALLVFTWAQVDKWQFPYILCLATICGALPPPVSAIAREIWSHRYSDGQKLHTAYAAESTLNEVSFLLGMVVTGVLAASRTGFYALLLCSFLRLAGCGWLSFQPGVEGWEHAHPGAVKRGSALRSRLLLLAMSVVILALAGLGSLDVGVMAYARNAHIALASGVLLALPGFGSIFGGVAYGARNWETPLWVQQAIWVALWSITVIFLLWSTSIWLVIPVLFISGIWITPLAIVQGNIVSESAPPGTRVEALTWLGTASYIGIGFGNSLAGNITDEYGTSSAYGIASLFAAVAAILSFRTYGSIKNPVGTFCRYMRRRDRRLSGIDESV